MGENELRRVIKKIHTFFLIGLIFISYSVSQIQTRKIADGFDKPIYAVSHPTDHKMIFVVEQKGVIKIVNYKTVLKLPFLDIQDRVHYPLFPGDEMGLLGFAFHPEFSKNGFCFVNYVDKTVIPYVDKKFDEADLEKSLVGNLVDELNDNEKQEPFSVDEDN